MPPPAKHILLSSVGVRPPESENTYLLNGVSQTSRFSAFGLWKLLPQEQCPEEIYFLLTPQAQDKSWPVIQREADALGVAVEPIQLLGDTDDDTRAFLETIANSIPEGSRLTLNVTEGLRHHAFLFYALRCTSANSATSRSKRPGTVGWKRKTETIPSRRST